jgi:hypothetical protein
MSIQQINLTAIYNVFDGEEHLERSVKCIRKVADWVIAVVQDVSNYGEVYEGGIQECMRLSDIGLIDEIIYFTPNILKGGLKNETVKRQLGIDRMKGRTKYFIQLDCDELHFDLEKAFKEFVNLGFDGSYCEMITYFKEPYLRYEEKETYFVPMFYKMKNTSKTGMGIKHLGVYTDPTRSVNCDRILKLNHDMHHYSYVRNDINRKIRNSSARNNLVNTSILEDYNNSRNGYFVKTFKKRLILTKNYFNEV